MTNSFKQFSGISFAEFLERVNEIIASFTRFWNAGGKSLISINPFDDMILVFGEDCVDRLKGV